MTSKLYRAGDTERFSGAADDDNYRSPFRRDYGRLIHSSAFRRLQGKTQLFPGIESDYFRNRLTHSLEVAQVAKSIALRINRTVEPFSADSAIDPDLMEFAGLAHDLGHPPFGHNGEKALNSCMSDHGGFEGNAQTLRVLTRLEKKATGDDDEDRLGITNTHDHRLGLNLTCRALASVLKYPEEIPEKVDKVTKGYYKADSEVVEKLRKKVDPEGVDKRTIECSIMDLADDIAYSTYDLDDAVKGGFVRMSELVAPPSGLCEEVAETITKNDEIKISAEEVTSILKNLVAPEAPPTSDEDPWDVFAGLYADLRRFEMNGYIRNDITSQLIREAVDAVEVDVNRTDPAFSVARLREDILRRTLVLKRYVYTSVIGSSQMKITEFRGQDIVKQVFNTLAGSDGHRLLPDDFKAWYTASKTESDKKRVICDFVAGMTDRYAIEFYKRLFSAEGITFYRPL